MGADVDVFLNNFFFKLEIMLFVILCFFNGSYKPIEGDVNIISSA